MKTIIKELSQLKADISSLRKEVKDIKRSLQDLIIPVEKFLNRRGFKYVGNCPENRLLIPRSTDQEYMEKYYEFMKKYSFRLLQRDVIKKKEKIKLEDLTHFCSPRTAVRYMNFLVKAGIVEKDIEGLFNVADKNINTFGETLEWFIARVLRKEFNCTADWGIKLHGLQSGGDFDVVAVMEGLMMFVEVKSSPPKHIHQNVISEFFIRMHDLRPDIAIFFIDTHLRLRDKINVLFKTELKNRKYDFEMRNFYSRIYRVNHNIFIINSKPDIVSNFRECLRYYFANR